MRQKFTQPLVKGDKWKLFKRKFVYTDYYNTPCLKRIIHHILNLKNLGVVEDYNARL